MCPWSRPDRHWSRDCTRKSGTFRGTKEWLFPLSLLSVHRQIYIISPEYVIMVTSLEGRTAYCMVHSSSIAILLAVVIGVVALQGGGVSDLPRCLPISDLNRSFHNAGATCEPKTHWISSIKITTWRSVRLFCWRRMFFRVARCFGGKTPTNNSVHYRAPEASLPFWREERGTIMVSKVH